MPSIDQANRIVALSVEPPNELFLTAIIPRIVWKRQLFQDIGVRRMARNPGSTANNFSDSSRDKRSAGASHLNLRECSLKLTVDDKNCD